MTKEDHNKIIEFVNSDDYMLLNSYISKPYEETIIEQDKEIQRLNNIIEELEKYLEKIIIDGGTRGSMTFWYRQIYEYLKELKGGE